jgi:hypothetical protein
VHAQKTSSLHGEPHSRTNLSGREGWTNKEQGTQHRDSFDRGDTDMGSLSDGDDGASSSQGSVSEGQNAEGHAVETMELQPAEGQSLFHEPVFSAVTLRWKKNAHRVTRTRITQNEVWNTTAQLIGDRQEFQDAIATPALFLAVPEWSHLGSSDTPLVGDMRELTLLDDRARQPPGGVAFQRQQGGWPVTDKDGRWLPNREWPKTPASGNWDRPSKRSRLFYNGQAVQPERWDRGGYYDPVVPQTLSLLRTREQYDPYSRGTDPMNIIPGDTSTTLASRHRTGTTERTFRQDSEELNLSSFLYQ